MPCGAAGAAATYGSRTELCTEVRLISAGCVGSDGFDAAAASSGNVDVAGLPDVNAAAALWTAAIRLI